MADEWYYTEDGERRGPVSVAELQRRASSGELDRSELVWGEGMADWLPAHEVPGLFDGGPVAPSIPAVESGPPAPAEASTKKLAAGICAILLGYLGVHKFILGYTTQGVILLVLSLVTCGAVGTVMGIIEGIVYLTKTDADFYRTYMVGRREWF